MVAQREREENELGHGFIELEGLTFGSIGFEKGYGEFARAWVTHTEHEELEQFDLLQDPMGPEALNVVNRYALIADTDLSAIAGTTYREMLASAEALLTG